MFSKTCEYGIRAMVSIAVKSSKGERTNLKQIAEDIESPEPFTAKILQQLSKSKLIVSTKGPNGGFQIPKEELGSIKLLDIVQTLDGDKLFTQCALGLRNCNSSKPCPVHHKFLPVREKLTKILLETSLEKMSKDIKTGMAFLSV